MMLKNFLSKILACLLLIAMLSACASDGRGNKAAGGTAVGAVAGGILGSTIGKGDGRILGAALGALAGAAIGGSIGSYMDEQDRQMNYRATQQSLEYNRIGQEYSWNNPDSGHYGTVVPTKTYTSSYGSYCREYTTTVNIGGKAQKAYGTACRQPDGTWQVQN